MLRLIFTPADTAKKPLVSPPRSVTMPVHRPGGEIGRHKRLKISRQQWRTGSIPVSGTMTSAPRSSFFPCFIPFPFRLLDVTYISLIRQVAGFLKKKSPESIAPSSPVFFRSPQKRTGRLPDGNNRLSVLYNKKYFSLS